MHCEWGRFGFDQVVTRDITEGYGNYEIMDADDRTLAYFFNVKVIKR